VLVDHRENALKIPNAALRFRPANAPGATQQHGQGASFRRQSARSQTVSVLGEDGKPEGVPVTLGITDGAMSEVTGGNLREGQQVIVGVVSEPTSGSAAAQPFGGGGKRGPRF